MVESTVAEPAQAVAVHDDDGVLDRLAAAWDELDATSRTPVTARRTWLQCWLRAHPDARVLAVTVHRDERLVGAALLQHRSRGLYEDVRPVAAGASDEVRLPALDAAAADALAHGLAETLNGLGRPWRLLLRDLPPGDHVAERLRVLLPHACQVPGDVSPRLALDHRRELRAYVSRNHHQQSRRLRNRVQQDGLELSVAQLRSEDEVRDVLPEVVAVCRARDLAARRFSALDIPTGLSFFQDLLVSHAAQDELRLTTLRLDGALAAYVLCFVDGDAWRMWNCRFAPQWAAYGPGRLSHDASLAAALEAGATTYDWMRGDEAYKEGMSDHVYRVVDLHAASSPVLWAGTEGLRRGRARLKDLKDGHPLTVKAWEQLRPVLASKG